MEEFSKFLTFKGGKLTKTEPPQWYRDGVAKDDDFERMLSKVGATGLDEYGEHGDTIKIYRALKNSYLAIFWDVSEIISLVVIEDLADYMLFKAQYIAPLGQLIMASDQHWVWQEERKKRRA
jgi:hypothetical protein